MHWIFQADRCESCRDDINGRPCLCPCRCRCRAFVGVRWVHRVRPRRAGPGRVQHQRVYRNEGARPTGSAPSDRAVLIRHARAANSPIDLGPAVAGIRRLETYDVLRPGAGAALSTPASRSRTRRRFRRKMSTMTKKFLRRFRISSHGQGAAAERALDRGHRHVRGERGLRLRGRRLAQGDRGRPRPHQPQRVRHRPRASPGGSGARCASARVRSDR